MLISLGCCIGYHGRLAQLWKQEIRGLGCADENPHPLPEAGYVGLYPHGRC